jgi:3-keto-L-gulonate-6-phosphate decarboxylase
MIAADASSFQSASQAVADHCTPAALADDAGPCRSALQSMDATVQRIQSDLAAQSVPSCLQAADRELRSALTLYHQGIQEELGGLDRGDPIAVIRGAGTLSQASGHMQAASSQLPSSC